MRIHPIPFVPHGQQFVRSRIANHHFCYQRLHDLIQPARLGSFFKRHMDRPAQSLHKIPDRFHLGLQD
jgi:hypothetical protein